MTEGGRLARNFFYTASTHGTNFLVLLLFVLAARYLGDESFGKFSYAFAFVTLFTQLTGYSVHNRVIIDVARDRSRIGTVFGNLLSLQIAASVVTFLLIVLVARLVEPRGEVRWIIALLAVAMISRAIKVSLRLLLKGLERFDLEAISQLLGQCGLFVTGILVLTASGDLLLFVALFAAARFADALLSYVWAAFRVGEVWPRFDWGRWPALARAGILYALIAGMQDIYLRSGTVVLGLMRSDAEVGWYNAALKLIDAIHEFPVILTYALFPALSVAFITSREKLTELYRRGIKYLLIVSIPVTLYILVAAPRLITAIYGDPYAGAIPVLRILGVAVTPAFLAMYTAYVLMATERAKAVLTAATVSTAVNVAANILLIRFYGAAGAALAGLATQVLLAGWLLSLLAREVHHIPWTVRAFRTAGASALLLATAWLLRESNPVLSFPVSFAVYGAGLLLFRVPDAKEWDVARGLAGRIRGREK